MIGNVVAVDLLYGIDAVWVALWLMVGNLVLLFTDRLLIQHAIGLLIVPTTQAASWREVLFACLLAPMLIVALSLAVGVAGYLVRLAM